MAVPFPAWRPDAYSLGSGFSREISGVLPGTGGYAPMPGLATNAEALAAGVCLGAITVRTAGGAVVSFAGTDGKLYKIAGAPPANTDVTRAAGGDYNVPDDGCWSFAAFDANIGGTATSVVVATNGVDAVQFIDVNSGTNFAPISGSSGASGTPPIGRYVKAVGDYLWLMDLPSASAVGQTGVASSGRIQVQRSGFRDFNHWTIGDKSSDFATFPYGGVVMGASGQLGGLIFLQRAIWRHIPRVDPVFDFAPFMEEQGTDAPYSIISNDAETYFYSSDGFSAVGVAGTMPIGDEWVDNWFLENLNRERVGTIVGALDPLKRRAVWLFPTTANESRVLDHIIVFDILNKERPWVHASLSASYIFQGATSGATLTSLTTAYSTLAAVPFPLGSPIWLGGVPGLAAFDSANKLSFFSGSALAGTMQTAQFQPVPGSRFYTNGFRFIGDASSATGRVYVAERPQDTETAQASESLTTEGKIPQRASGRLMTAEVTIPAGATWSFANGVDFAENDIVPDGKR